MKKQSEKSNRCTVEQTCKTMLDQAHEYAERNSGCCKVSVGSVIFAGLTMDRQRIAAYGANRTIPYNCKKVGCLRIDKYGEDSKNHRNPEDCRAIHSEIDAIARMAQRTASSLDLAIAVTRYPCEACAKAIIAAGIKNVVYGRKQEISYETAEMFRLNNVLIWHIEDWDAPDVTY